MANYYNVRGWKHTGYNYHNRPENRSVLMGAYFTNINNYFTMNGIAVKRDAFEDLTYIDLQGSVKDSSGTQVNAAGSTGTHGPGGPFYHWEEVDYLMLSRTGYPGDGDYVDINGNMNAPWANTRTAFYFVDKTEPLGRNVTRLHLLYDEWLSSGGSDELQIESGFKIRGPITDTEDAAGYNIAPESIGLIEPMEVKDSGYIMQDTTNPDMQLVVSSTELTQYDPADGDIMGGILAEAQNPDDPTEKIRTVFPKIKSVNTQSSIKCNVIKPDGTTALQTQTLKGYALFNLNEGIVQHNLTMLYSAGQLELMDSFKIPAQYIDTAYTDTQNARLQNIQNKAQNIASPVQKDIGTYPRKADYFYGQEVLFSTALGSMNIQPFYELTDDSINVWALCTPNGYPVARFKGIKGHFYEYDQSINGMPWLKQAIVLQGASGSMWNTINNAYSQARTRTAAILQDYANQQKNIDWTTQALAKFASFGLGAAFGGVESGVNNLKGQVAGAGGGDPFSGIASGISGLTNRYIDYNVVQPISMEDIKNQQIQTELGAIQGNFKAPYTDFVPDLNSASFQTNGFGVYVLNTTAKDRTRLKNFFNRYGYSGQYEALTWNKVFVKQKVNYIQTEGAMFTHPHIPQRTINRINEMFNNGVFLWSEKPNQAAFNNNPDRS